MAINRGGTTLKSALTMCLAATATAAMAMHGQGQRVAGFEITGRFASSAITESSGVASSRRHQGILWTHNDSGDGPFIYATDLRGGDHGSLRVSGARAEDWEDMALGPCPQRGETRDCLYIADIGDNLEARVEVGIYVVPEPEPRTSGPFSGETEAAWHLRVRYPDGPQDAEALAITGSGQVWLVTKGRRRPPSIYSIPANLTEEVITASRLHTLGWNTARDATHWVTAAAISQDGNFLALRSYMAVHLFDLRRIDQGPIEVASCLIGTRQLMGEAVDFLNESDLVVTSEAFGGQPGTIGLARCATYGGTSR